MGIREISAGKERGGARCLTVIDVQHGVESDAHRSRALAAMSYEVSYTGGGSTQPSHILSANTQSNSLEERGRTHFFVRAVLITDL